MIDRPGAAVFAISMPWIIACAGMAQDFPSPDVTVDVNEGIYLYVSGERDPQKYTDAVAVLTSVLERDSNNTTALLFRALSYGELGLEELRARRVSDNFISGYTVILKARQDETVDPTAKIQQFEEEIAGYQASGLRDPATLAKWNIAMARLLDAGDIKRILDRTGDIPDEQFEELLRAEREKAQAFMRGEKQSYENMTRDVTRLLGLLDDPAELVMLLDVVANAKIARIDETTARNLIDGRISDKGAQASSRELRQNASQRLAVAEQTLKQILEENLASELRTRAQFILGVILFRQAVPMRAESEGYTSLSPKDIKRLREALALMKGLADDPATAGLYAPYSPFYVGLIVPFLAAAEMDAAERERLLNEAEDYLDLAGQRDVEADETGAPRSITNIVPSLVAQQRKQIQDLRESAGTTTAVSDINDIRFSIGLGLNRDTNVVLLGERTDLPRDISREEDYGLSLITAVDYTKQLAPGWIFGFQGRVTQLWHADVDEYDQQTYGGTVALQHEIMEKRDRFGPVYLSMQYDYDYTLLGRSAFLESHALRPSVRAYWNERRGESELYARYNIRDYREPLSDRRYNRDGTYGGIGFLHKHKCVDMTPYYQERGIEPWGHSGDPEIRQDDPDYPSRFLTGRWLLEYGWDSTDGDEFDRKSYATGFGVGMPLPWGIDMDFVARYEWGEYAHGSLIDFHRRPRRDFIQEYSLGVARTFVLQPGDYQNRFSPQFDRTVMTVRAFVDYTDDDSNVVDRSGQAVFSYDRWVYGITFGFAFN